MISKNIFIILLISVWYTISVCQAEFHNDKEVDKVINDFLTFTQEETRSKSNQSYSEIENKLNTTFLVLLIDHGTNVFKTKRALLKKRLAKNTKNNFWYWMKKIDQQILKNYLLHVSKIFLQLPRNHIAHQYYYKLVEILEQDHQLPFEWINRLTYKGKSRGLYYHENRQISLDILSPDELILPLIHELGHKFDPELKVARSNPLLKSMRFEIERFYYTNHIKWSTDQKLIFGKYWFLKSSYLESFKEYLPRIYACQTFVDLFLLNLLKKPAKQDLRRYADVLDAKLNCHQLTSRELQLEYPYPDFFWSKSKWQYKLVNKYYFHWMRQNQIPSPIY